MQLFHLFSNDSEIQSYPVLCFYGNEYQLLFFSHFIKSLRQRSQLPIEFLDYGTQENGILQVRASASFLGMNSIFWLNNCSSLESRRKTELMNFLAKYQGPHRIWLFDDASPAQLRKEQSIEVPSLINKHQFDQLVTFFYEPEIARRLQFYTIPYFTTIESLTLDQACLLMNYGLVVGNEQQKFAADWLPHIIPCEKSLFTLSQHFFGRNEKKFFLMWSTIKNEYSDQFWISFWSEQLFRSFHVVACMHKKDFAQAKTLAFRLPFSLMQYDWKKNNPDELSNAHQFLYRLDYGIKNGGTNFGLDLFFSKFFLGEFAELATTKFLQL